MKEIWCTRQLLVSICLKFLNWCTQSSLSWFQYFGQNHFLCWIFYLTSCILASIILLSNCLLSICSIEIDGVEILRVNKINNEGFIWFIQGLGLGRKATNVIDRLGKPSYTVLCDTPRSISDVHGNHLFHLVLSLSTTIPNWCYLYSKTLNRSGVCIGLFISFCGA